MAKYEVKLADILLKHKSGEYSEERAIIEIKLATRHDIRTSPVAKVWVKEILEEEPERWGLV
jgi:hypothetical protein